MPTPGHQPRGGSTLTHKMGRRPCTPEMRARAIPLRPFLNLAVRPIPPADDFASKAQAALDKMMGNDTQGCCVATWLAKLIGIINSYRPGGSTLVATAAEVLAWYHEVGGPGDNGLYMPDALDYATRVGMKIGGVRHKIDGWAMLDVRDTPTLDAGFHWFLGVGLGVNLTQKQYSDFATGSLWDYDGSRVVGGHAIPLTKRGSDRFTLATWAQQPEVTRECVQNPRWAEEAYVVISREAFDAAGHDSNAVKWDALSAAMDAVRNGQTPVIPDDPAPPNPPFPPTPPDTGNLVAKGVLDFFGNSLPITITGNVGATVAANTPAGWLQILDDVLTIYSAARRLDWAALAAAVEKLLADLGLTLTADETEQFVGAIMTRVQTRALGCNTPPASASEQA